MKLIFTITLYTDIFSLMQVFQDLFQYILDNMTNN